MRLYIGLPSEGLLWSIHKPVYARDHYHAPEHIAACDRQDIVDEKSGPREIDQLLGTFTSDRQHIRIAPNEQADSNNVHVGDGVFKPGCNSRRYVRLQGKAAVADNYRQTGRAVTLTTPLRICFASALAK
jgi:hypothetical protein